jgi:membrane-associated phospholipid phosphatase
MPGSLRRSEWVLGAFFFYIAFLGAWRNHGVSVRVVAAAIIPVAIVVAARADSFSVRSGWSVARDWIPAVLVLVAYWSIDWVPTAPPNRELEGVLIGWDRTVLYDWGLRAATERFGVLVPAVLELAYLALYAVLPLIIASFYVRHERDRLDEFVFPFLLGTLVVYALLPHFPVEGPRFAFPGEDLPAVETVFRRMNLWILNHWDIRSSVLPSGHVAAAFSAAFAMGIAAPQRRALTGALLVMAVLVWVNTVYGRYHYGADGLAGLGVSAAAIGSLVAYRALSTKMRPV